MQKPNTELIKVQRHIVEYGLNRQHRRNQSVTMHNIGDADDLLRIFASFDDTLQWTLRGKTIQVLHHNLFVCITIVHFQTSMTLMMKKEGGKKHLNFHFRMRGFAGQRQLVLPKTDHYSSSILE